MLLLVTGCDVPPVEVITITSDGFEPASITVPAGTEVRFVNQVAGRASVTSLDPVSPADVAGSVFDSGPLVQGQAWRLLVEEPGEHIYHSTYHSDPNWVGTISVEDP